MVQCGTRSDSKPNIHGDNEEVAELLSLRDRGNTLYRAGKYLSAVRVYQSGYAAAKRSGHLRFAVRFLNNLGSAHYQVFRYRDAVQAYLEARDLATLLGDQETIGALCFNLSSLYFDMGDTEAALDSAERGLKLPSAATAKFKAKQLTQHARIKRRQKNSEQAIALLRAAIEVSRAERDVPTEAQAWNELGNTLRECGQLTSAEKALLEAFRLRERTHDDRLYFSYSSLGHLRVLQGDLRSASALYGKAIAAARTVSPSAMWNAYYARGKVRVVQKRLAEAFADFGAALAYARRWRAEVLPADAFRISSEVELHEIYSSFIELGSRLYGQTGRKRFLQLTFAAAEENRAASLRALWAGPDLTKKLPNEYWEALADLHKAEIARIKGDRDADTAVRRLQLRMSEIEIREGLDFPRDPAAPDSDGTGLLRRTQSSLDATAVFLGFHVGDAESYLWVVTRQGFELQRLPPRAQLVQSVAAFVKALRESSADAFVLGNRLYSQLFGGVSRRLLDKHIWIVAPDGPLFEMPFSALVEGTESHLKTPAYVIERHVVRIVPGVAALFGTTPLELNGPAVAVGDPIYNRADPRWTRRPSAWNFSTGGQPPLRPPIRPIELARLVGSGREVENCATIWRSHGYKTILLTGAAASKANLTKTMGQNPSLLHLAVHVLFSTQPFDSGTVALALQSAGEIELLGATEIASMRQKLGLVVLNGCSSAHAVALPGAGLMGMTRAWLAAGARAVIATRWAIRDEDGGELFQSLYDSLSCLQFPKHQGWFAQLLQQAQLTELRAKGRRAHPGHWASYMCVERN
jgi:CHAT domain-containing protein/tetratricopeptide (TPR) repeat protein